jgi:FeS assembly SUF system protein
MKLSNPAAGVPKAGVRMKPEPEAIATSGGLMISRDEVMAALKECYDPEIPVNIVDLGLVYDVRITDSGVEIDMTLTAPGCPMSAMISDDVKSKLEQVEGVKSAVVKMVWDPPWTPERMSDDAKKSLGFS